MFSGAEAPQEYLEYILCKHFGVLPSVIREAPLDDMLLTLSIMNTEAKVQKRKSEMERARSKGKRGGLRRR